MSNKDIPSSEAPLSLPKEPISEDHKKKMLSNAVYHLTKQEQFYGNLLQEITIKYNEMIPTAGITFNKKSSQYEVYVNPYFFDHIKPEERVAVFQHEILHFTNKHLFRFPFLIDKTTPEERSLYNIAGDMAINQFIKNLPEGCVDHKKWKMDNGEVFPSFLTMEQYFDLIKDEKKKQSQADGEPKPQDGSEESKQMNSGQGPKDSSEVTKGNVAEQLKNYKQFDQHDWDQLDEETKKKMLDEAGKVIKRTIEKTSTSYTKIPDSIKDLLVEIDSISANLNYKALLRAVIKKTVSCVDRESTWKKPNKRYGCVSPGTKVGALPNLSFYIDTSGSISLKELNMFLHVMSNFLQVGNRNCQLGLWHTTLYYKKKYKLHTELNKEELESGGTDVQAALMDIKKTNPNLSIILTDMYFEQPDLMNFKGEILFIISEGGNKNHNFKLPSNCKVISLENLK